MNRNREREHEKLYRLIQRWNEKRVALFKITLPDEKNYFEGVMKFYYQYEGTDGQKVATKCIKVTSSMTVIEVIEILVQKFRPDLKMLPNIDSYSLYEIHDENGEKEVRKMDASDKPLLAMMKWSKGDREGRFLLRNESSFTLHQRNKGNRSPKKVKKSPKEKRKPKAKPYLEEDGSIDDPGRHRLPQKDSFADTLYENYPPSKFTRSITNPEIIKNLWNNPTDKHLRSSYQAIDELDNEENIVPIITGSLVPEMPSKTILATKNDTAAQIVRTTVEKFRLEEDPTNFCLVQVVRPSGGGSGIGGGGFGRGEKQERILADDECPVIINTRWKLGEPGVVNWSTLQFQLRRRSSLRSILNPQPTMDLLPLQEPALPCLVEVSNTPTSTPSRGQKKHIICSFPVEIGSRILVLDPQSHICINSPGIAPRHCIISVAYRGSYAISPLDQQALTFVNSELVTGTAPLPINSIIQLGESELFKFSVPGLHSLSNSTIINQSTSEFSRGDVLGKAYSTDNLLSTSNGRDHPMEHGGHNRTFSEHTLKNEMGVLGGEEEEQDEKDDKDQFDTTDDETPGSVTSIKMTRNVKKRHNSAPHSRDPNFLAETPESELAVLPASITFTQKNENVLLQMLISEVNGCILEFKLAPAYSLYMIARHHLSSEYHPEPNRHLSLIHMLKQTCSCIKRAVKESKSIAGALALWLSNTSELLHFLRRDYQLCMFAHEYENTLTSIVHMAYKHFTEFMVCEIGLFLSAFLSESPEADREDIVLLKREGDINQPEEPDVVPHGTLTRQASLTSMYWTPIRTTRKGKATLGCILSSLTAAVSLLHQCHVNNTLSIFIFNLLFRYISMKLFNKLISEPRYCTRSTGTKLLRRLDRLKAWANKEGLKMPAEDHLAIIVQAGRLLQFPKKNPEDTKLIHSTCHRLNSRQISKLLSNCETAEGEGSVNKVLKDQLITLATQNVDHNISSSGLDINLQEDPNLELPFLIPEQGYSCDRMRGLPVGLEEYLDSAISAGLCQLHITKDTLGCWVPPRMTTSNQRESPLSTQASTQMSQTLPKNFPQNPYASVRDYNLNIQRPHSTLNLATTLGEAPKIVTVKLRKAERSLGINICEGKVQMSGNPEELCIFIKSLSGDGPASKDGRLHPGDQILKVDNTVLSGFTRDMVIKLLRNSGSEVTLTLAKEAAQYYGLSSLVDSSSPCYERKAPQQQQYESSHSIKAYRRHLRQQMNEVNISKHGYHPSTDQHNLQLFNGYNQTARWIKEQRDRAHYKLPEHPRMSKPSQSLSSLIPEKEEAPLRQNNLKKGSGDHTPFDSRFLLSATPPCSDTSNSMSQLFSKPSFESHNILGTVSKLHDPLSTRSNPPSYSAFSHQAQPFSNSLEKEMPASLSVQPSETSDPSGSQAYPSLMLEKLSMEVGCHTQSNSSAAGLTVTSVLEQLTRKSRDSKEGGLKQTEVKGLDVDELELEKQRMKLLFYEQQKDRQDSEVQHLTSMDKQSPVESKVDEWGEEGEDTVIDPEKLLQITKLQQKLESLKKMISDQRKRNRECQFAKDRVRQSLADDEKKFRSQQSRNFKPLMRPEDELRWQKEQKRRLKDWEKLKREKSVDLQQHEVKEREGRARLKALEQHLGEIKKQLQACEGFKSRMLSATESFGSSKLMEDIPEREWTDANRPPRVMSTDSITTGSSLFSGDNSEIAKDLISLDSDTNLPGMNDYNILPARSSPFGNRSDSSSPIGQAPSYGRRYMYMYNPDVHESMEIGGSSVMEQMNNSKMPLMRGNSADQDRRLRMLKEEHNLHMSSMDSIPFRSAEDQAFQLRQLRKEMQDMKSPEPPELDLPASTVQNWGSKASTNLSHYKGSIDSSNVDSSLSNTPDVIPDFLVKPIHQSSSAMNLPYHSDPTRPFSYGKHSRPSSGFGFSNAQSNQSSRGGLPLEATSSSEFLTTRINSRENLLGRPEAYSTINTYSSHGNVQQPSTLESDLHHPMDAIKTNYSKKVYRQANSPSTHKYSHRRPDPPINGDDRFKYRAPHSLSHSNLLSVDHNILRQQTEL